MVEEIAKENTYNSFLELFGNKAIEDVELLKLGFVGTKCYTPKIALLLHCMDNIEIFNKKQLENLNILINKYKYV